MDNRESKYKQRYAVKRKNGEYSVMWLLPFDDFYEYYLRLFDEIEVINGQRWLRLYSFASLDEANYRAMRLSGNSTNLPLIEEDLCTK